MILGLLACNTKGEGFNSEARILKARRKTKI